MKKIFNFLLVIASVIISLFLIEILCRFSGKTPFQYTKKSSDEPTTNEFDETLGWKPKLGAFKFKPWSPVGKVTTLTNTVNGRKDLINDEGMKKIIFLGGSFTQGFAVDDKETFAYLVEKELAEFNVENYGVGGYGTYQSLLKLENLEKKKIEFVFYGYVDHHDLRNIAQDSWLKMLMEYSNRGGVKLPYVSLENDDIIRYEPTKFIELPFRKNSALIHLIEKKIMYFNSRSRYKARVAIRNNIINEMNLFSQKNDFNYVTLILNTPNDNLNKIIKFHNDNKIKYLNCNIEKFEDEMIVKNEGHPNSSVHYNWSKCITHYIRMVAEERLDPPTGKL
tara:strand:+ start:551 stop:1558 length:1008 start_codon:yes stop_codon:yes gene_type:complete